VKGPNTSFSAGCVTGLDTVAYGRELLLSGRAKVVIAGAAEACMSRHIHVQLCRLGVLSRHNGNPQGACRPYDATRDGLVLGEGSAALVMERADDAMDRGASIYAEVVGHGSATEAQDMVRAETSGEELAHALEQALQMARLAPTDIDYVCAHGIGSQSYDLADTRALKRVLGERAYHIPVSSIKPVTGQPFSASGSLTTAAACLAIKTHTIPPTLNYRVPDPECDLDYVTDSPRRSRVDTVAVNAHSFGGTHAALIVRRFSENGS